MVFIIGGVAQGKNKYAEERFGDFEIIHDYHKIIRQKLEKGENAMEAAKKMLEASDPERLVVVCDEVGCGLVPMDAFERSYRETVGRVSCFLADKATQVIRLVAGLPVRIK